MPHPHASLPIDDTLVLPPPVRAAAAAADAAHQQAYATPEPTPEPTPAPAPAPAPVTAVVTEPVPAPPPAPAPAPEPAAPAPSDVSDVSDVQWEHRYNSMKGRFDQATQTIGSMQQQMQELGDELIRTQALSRQSAQRRPAPQPPAAPLLTPKDVETYGPELVDMVKRAAREAVMPDLRQTQNTIQRVNQRVVQVTQQDVYHSLDSQVPDWRSINENPRFIAWCRLPDVYSGQLRSALLNAAFQAADAPRVVAFFRGFHNEEVATGQVPAPQTEPQPAPRTPAVQLESLVAPGKAKPATGTQPQTPADKPIFTRAQIANFYTLVRQNHYAGREQDKQRDEQAIFAAQRDGRVR